MTRADRVGLAVGIAVTVALSLVPTVGLVTGFVLPLVQVFCIERATRIPRRHFGPLHGLVYDLFSAFVFLVLVAGQSAAGAILGSAASLIGVPLFVLAWLAARARVKTHLRRVADGRRPHALAL